MKLRIFIAVLSLGVWVNHASANPSPAIFPYEPAQLLGVLPTAPAEWKVIRSEADGTLGEWLETRATRVFQGSPVPVTAGGEGAPAAAPGEIEISVLDTAGFGPSLANFANFVPGKTGNLEKKLIGSLPSIAITSENGRQFVQVLVSSRYVIELTLTNLPRQRVEDWLRAFHFETLPPASQAPTSRPREFRLKHVDELQPKNNRSYAVSTTNAKRVDAFLRTLPAAPAESAGGEQAASARP